MPLANISAKLCATWDCQSGVWLTHHLSIDITLSIDESKWDTIKCHVCQSLKSKVSSLPRQQFIEKMLPVSPVS